MKWIYEKALERAETFGIQGVTYQLTLGVVKNIIPAIASTNALVSAACVNEAFKFLTGCNYQLNNYMMFMGQTGIYTNTFVYGREADCYVCSRKEITFNSTPATTLHHFIQDLKEKLRLNGPSIGSTTKGVLYMPSPASLEEKYRPNLHLTFR